VSPIIGVDAVKKRKKSKPGIEPGQSSMWLIAIPTETFGLRLKFSYLVKLVKNGDNVLIAGY
jgi:hypothetical protein